MAEKAENLAQGTATVTATPEQLDSVKYGKAEAAEIEVARTAAAADGSMSEAQKAGIMDDRLRRENANAVVYREADPKVGGGSFDYGLPPKQ